LDDTSSRAGPHVGQTTCRYPSNSNSAAALASAKKSWLVAFKVPLPCSNGGTSKDCRTSSNTPTGQLCFVQNIGHNQLRLPRTYRNNSFHAWSSPLGLLHFALIIPSLHRITASPFAQQESKYPCPDVGNACQIQCRQPPLSSPLCQSARMSRPWLAQPLLLSA
jgi:hypothetical protein